jgi:glucuronate isomerase
MTRPFIHDDFLLESERARDLFHRVAAPLPIVDFHCHISPADLVEDRRFASITEAWLGGDHYKWRLMRSNGVPEVTITGRQVDDWERFAAWAATVPFTVGNPAHHWTHLELARVFGISELLSPATARDIYERCNARLAEADCSALGLLRQFRVDVLCTTDDPVDTLEEHRKLAARTDVTTRVFPTWRADQAMAIESAEDWNSWVNQLEAVANRSVTDLDTFIEALDARHAVFHEAGCRASDHGLQAIESVPTTTAAVRRAFDVLRRGQPLMDDDAAVLRSFLLERMAEMDHDRGWVQQFHLGALRNVSRRLRDLLGRDCGGDVIGDFEQARPLARFLGSLDARDRLAPTILYNLNSRDNDLLPALMGAFQDGSRPGKLQYGPSWWFLDHIDGMEAQLRSLANLGLLARFVGMVTDSRSLLSYCRHEYFRRVLCNWVAQQVDRGRIPDDRQAVDELISNISYHNAARYFGYEKTA